MREEKLKFVVLILGRVHCQDVFEVHLNQLCSRTALLVGHVVQTAHYILIDVAHAQLVVGSNSVDDLSFYRLLGAVLAFFVVVHLGCVAGFFLAFRALF